MRMGTAYVKLELDTEAFDAALERAKRVTGRWQLAMWRRELADERREHDTGLAAASGIGWAGEDAWTAPTDVMSERFYVLMCRECGDPPMPFPSPEERGEWAAAHTAATGHERWWARDYEYTPPPEARLP